ncbi:MULTISPECIES: hypothetical protein [unclassified Paenibacillus]|uniref:hypothetical protein n=1 Tax=unclassified Paenibacillus TaxID=185978 RepID=UPI00363DBACB
MTDKMNKYIQTNPAQLVTPGELLLVKMELILSIMLDVLQSDIQKIKQANLKLNVLYALSLSNAHESVHSELMELRVELKKRDIKILEEIRAKDGVQAQFICRGYDHNLLIQWKKVRAAIVQKGSQYWDISLSDSE